ncbi:hypothetical protein Pfo_008128 [Paulownia fortunei]|nr:hypothetical protein Pfo_008128 [Paulownia fortunei]
MECDESCMIGKMKDSKKSSRFSRAPAANLRQVKIVVPEDRHSKVGVKSKLSRSNAALSKNRLAWYVALNSKPSEEKISHIPQIKWKCPPKFALNTGWHVATGEGSQEAEAQKCRETTVLEVVYPHLSAIPPSSFVSLHMGGEYYDDNQIPIIPIIPIEAAAAAEMPFDTSAPVNTCINSQPPSSPKGSSVSRNLSLSQWSPSGPQDQPVNDKSVPDILRGIESGDLEVAVAAVATVAAVMESKEQIDPELLIKFLSNPEMVKKLIDENGLRAKPEHGTPPAPEPNASLPFPTSTPASVVDKLANECSEPLSTAIPSNSRPQAVNQSLALSCTKVETAINKSASQQGGPAHSHIHQIAGVKQVRPLVPSTLRPDEETIKRLINQYGAPDIAGVKPVTPLKPSTSKPNVEAIKKLINEYGAPDAAGIKPVAPLIATTSRPLNMEEMKKTRNEYGVPDHGSFKPFLGPNPLFASTPLKAAMVMPPTANLANLHALPNALESNFTATGIFHFPSFSPRTIPAPPVDLHYYKSLIKQHGEKHETGEHKLLKFGQPGNYLQGLEMAHKTTPIEMNPKYQKPCMYFSSSNGCRNGSNCPYQHEVSEQWRTGGVVDVPVAKRMKFSEWIGKL